MSVRPYVARSHPVVCWRWKHCSPAAVKVRVRCWIVVSVDSSAQDRIPYDSGFIRSSGVLIWWRKVWSAVCRSRKNGMRWVGRIRISVGVFPVLDKGGMCQSRCLNSEFDREAAELWYELFLG